MLDKTIREGVTREDIEILADQVRPADRAEWAAVSGPDIGAILSRGVESSAICWVWEIGGDLGGALGVVPHPTEAAIGMPWFISTKVADDHPAMLAQVMGLLLPAMLTLFPTLTNAIDGRNAQNVRMLDSLGFTLHPPRPLGAMDVPFHPFVIHAETRH